MGQIDAVQISYYESCKAHGVNLTLSSQRERLFTSVSLRTDALQSCHTPKLDTVNSNEFLSPL